MVVILFVKRTGMYIVDQHAGQERINYEYYLEKYANLDYRWEIY